VFGDSKESENKTKKPSNGTTTKSTGKNALFNESIFGDISGEPVTSTELPDNFSTTKMTTTKKITTPTKPIYLHAEEQANSRFYLSAKDVYTCVIYNATRTFKHVNINHNDNYKSENVSAVIFRNCSILHIPELLFDLFPNMKWLSVENCGIKSMDTDLLEKCGNLRYLDMSNNKIRYVDGDSVKNCPKLRSIDLSGNKVETVKSDIFTCNPDLTIDLGNVKIVSPTKPDGSDEDEDF
jgi:hypothetical protein